MFKLKSHRLSHTEGYETCPPRRIPIPNTGCQTGRQEVPFFKSLVCRKPEVSGRTLFWGTTELVNVTLVVCISKLMTYTRFIFWGKKTTFTPTWFELRNSEILISSGRTSRQSHKQNTFADTFENKVFHLGISPKFDWACFHVQTPTKVRR